MLPLTKVCPSCGLEKQRNDFHTRRDKGKIYLKSYCKTCSNKTSFKGQYDTCVCGSQKTKKSKVCVQCSANKRTKFITLRDTMFYRGKHGQSAAFAAVRLRARIVMKHIKSCQRCGYDKHVEVCHIKPISEYDLDTLISVINDPSNLIVLCPNHHWEFDHLTKWDPWDSNPGPTD